MAFESNYEILDRELKTLSKESYVERSSRRAPFDGREGEEDGVRLGGGAGSRRVGGGRSSWTRP